MPVVSDYTSGNPATVDDITARWRPLSDQETTNANVFLDDAWALLTDRRPLLEGNIVAGTVSQQNVIRVVCQMVLRVLKNPDGWAQESLDDWSGRRDALLSSGLLTVTPDELADVTPGRKSPRSVRMVAYGELT